VALLTPALPAPLVRTTSRRFVLGVAGLVVALRLGYLVGPLFSDEAGYLLVAQDWHAGGPNLYGRYFVDRPPLLLALYRLAVVTGWPLTVRLLATLLSAVLVVSAAWAAHQVVGERGARWATLVAAAFAVTPVLMSQEADGEILAAPLVMLSMALTLAAVRRAGGRAFGLAVLAGVVAGAAVMVKQNFADAVVFAVVLLAASLVQRRVPPPVVARVAAGGVLGGLGVVAAALAYVAWSGVGLGTAWSAVFGFRGTALDVIADQSLHAPMMRAVEMTWLAVLCGALPLMVVLWLEAVRCRFRGPPVAWAVGATLALDFVSITAGGSYWPHYLLQLAPALSLAVGLWAADSARVRAAVALTVASAVAATVVVTLSGSAFRHTAATVGDFVHRSAQAGDTATVLFGKADVQQATGLRSPYEHLWTLPMRTLDPHLTELQSVLRGPSAPTWVVAWGDLDPWNIDARDGARLALATHYRRVADVCGKAVYLHDGVHRTLAPVDCP
jgi:4-amino-4-deoxy-L-arabinose transferase-like glycosyltransferase